MSFFDEDPFETIVREFFGHSPSRERYKEEIIHGEEEDRVIDFVEHKNKTYLIFELPGFDEKDIFVSVKDRKLEIKVKKRNKEGIQAYMVPRLSQEEIIRKPLPKFIDPKTFSYTVKNGVLEVAFNKK